MVVAAMVESLPPIEIPGHVSSGLGNEHHPMRIMTRRAAGLDSGGWDQTAIDETSELFDTLAPEWHTRTSPQRTEVVRDALRRGHDPIPGGRNLLVEVGAGIGTYSGLLAKRYQAVLALDLSFEMIRKAPPNPAHQIVADASRLPIEDGSADALILINAFFFPSEVSRVLRVGGRIVWVNSSGEQTPIHLSTEDLVKSTPFPVHGVQSRAGAGTWCVLVRSG